VTSIRVGSLVVVIALLAWGLTAPSGRARAEPPAAEAPVAAPRLELEEDTEWFTVPLSKGVSSDELSAFGGPPGLELVAWRRTSTQGQEARVRMKVGWIRAAERGRFLDARLDEELTAADLAALIDTLTRLGAVEFGPAPAHVKERFAVAEWGHLRLSRNESGYTLRLPGVSWERIDLDAFLGGLRRAAADLKTLVETPPSARLR
jgi:hypothetical protein